MANQTPITVMVWDQAKGTGESCDDHMAGFAQFILEDHRLPSENRITGRFVRTVTPGAVVPQAGDMESIEWWAPNRGRACTSATAAYPRKTTVFRATLSATISATTTRRAGPMNAKLPPSAVS